MQVALIFKNALEANSTSEACTKIRPLLTWLSEMIIQGSSKSQVLLEESKRQSLALEINKASEVLQVNDSLGSLPNLESVLMNNFESLISGVETSTSQFANLFSFFSSDALDKPQELSLIARKRLLTLGLNASKASEIIFGRIDSFSQEIITRLKETLLGDPDHFGQFFNAIYDSDNNIIAPKWSDLFIDTIESLGKQAKDFIDPLVNFLNHPSKSLESDGDIEFLAKRTLRRVRDLSKPVDKHFVDMPEILEPKQSDLDQYIDSLDPLSKDFAKQLKPLFRVHPGQLKKLIGVTEIYFNNLNAIKIDLTDSDTFKSIQRVADIVTLVVLNSNNDQINQNALNQLIDFQENLDNPVENTVESKTKLLRHHLNKCLFLILENKDINLNYFKEKFLTQNLEARQLEKTMIMLGSKVDVDDKKLIDKLRSLLNHDNEFVRARSVYILGCSDDEDSFQDIVNIANNASSIKARISALFGISILDLDFKKADSRLALVNALSHEDSLLSTHCAKNILDKLISIDVNIDWLKEDLKGKITPNKICDNLVLLSNCASLVNALDFDQKSALISHLSSGSASQIDIKKVFELLSKYDKSSLLDVYVESLEDMEYKLRSRSIEVLEDEQITIVMRACFYASRNQEAVLIEPLTKLLIAMENNSMLKVNIVNSLLDLTKGPHDPKIPVEYLFHLSKVSIDSPRLLLELLSVNK